MSKPLTRPRRLFRNRPERAPEVISLERRGDVLTLGRQPGLASVKAWVEANRSRFKPGTMTEVIVAHDPGCRYPAGDRCTCATGPEIRIEGLRPEDN